MTTAKKAAAAPKKTAASASANDAATEETTTETIEGDGSTPDGSDGAEGNDDETTPEDSGSTDAASGNVETGPGTGAPATPETGARPLATIPNTAPEAAPLSPPADHHLQTQPVDGYKTSSTDQTYAEVGGRTIAGENLVALVNRAGEPVDIATLFEDPGPRFTHMVSTERVYEKFTYPNTKTVDKRLLFPKGALVPRAQAVRIQAAAKADLAAAAE